MTVTRVGTPYHYTGVAADAKPTTDPVTSEPVPAGSRFYERDTGLRSVYDGSAWGSVATAIPDGVVGTPGLRFGSDPDNGIYRIGANNWGLAANGALVLEVKAGGLTLPDNVTLGLGTSDGEATLSSDGTDIVLNLASVTPALKIKRNAAAGTQYAGLTLTNLTASTVGTTSQRPPFLSFHGSAWKSNAVAASWNVDMRFALYAGSQPDSVAATLGIDASINDGAWVTPFRFYYYDPAGAAGLAGAGLWINKTIEATKKAGLALQSPVSTADVLRWYDYNGTIEGRIDEGGHLGLRTSLRIDGNSDVQTNGTIDGLSYMLGILPDILSPNPAFVIKGLLDHTTNDGAMIRIHNSVAAKVFGITARGNLTLGPATAVGTNATHTLSLGNGTVPGSSPADMAQLYAADIVAGNSALHTRTEGGAVIKLYQQPLIADPAGGGTQDAEARAAVVSVLDLLINNGLMAAA